MPILKRRNGPIIFIRQYNFVKYPPKNRVAKKGYKKTIDSQNFDRQKYLKNHKKKN